MKFRSIKHFIWSFKYNKYRFFFIYLIKFLLMIIFAAEIEYENIILISFDFDSPYFLGEYLIDVSAILILSFCII